MALDPNIILRAGEYKGPDVAETLERRAQIGIRNATLARAQRQEQEAAAKTVRLGSIGAKVAKGDYAGGAADAAGAGDFETVKTIQGLEGDSLKRAYDIAQRTAPMLLSLKQFPPEQRAAALAKIAPDLIASGFKPDHISQIDTSESGLNAIGQSALTVAQQYENASKDRSYALDTDKFAYQKQHDAAQMAVSREANFLSSGYVPPAVDGQPLTGGGGGAPAGPQIEAVVTSFMPGVSITSRQRDPAKNASVGGVGNSFHLTNDARDFVPPKGVSMAQLASVVRAKLPGYDVINEGDHVHVEPSSRSQGSGGGAGTALAVLPGGKIDRQRAADARADAREARAEAREARADGKVDRAETAATSKTTIALRKEFDALPEVKTFKIVRSAGQQVRSLATKQNPTATDDIALIFSYMKMLDPNSVVREGEFATAQNAAGVPDQVRNLYERALNGTRLNPEQRQNMVKSAARVYAPIRETYNDVARRYRTDAQDQGIDPSKVAYVATPSQARTRGTLSANVPTMTPDQARNAPKGARFRTTDGRVMVRQ